MRRSSDLGALTYRTSMDDDDEQEEEEEDIGESMPVGFRPTRY
jgi:hypothetical protein